MIPRLVLVVLAVLAWSALTYPLSLWIHSVGGTGWQIGAIPVTALVSLGIGMFGARWALRKEFQ